MRVVVVLEVRAGAEVWTGAEMQGGKWVRWPFEWRWNGVVTKKVGETNRVTKEMENNDDTNTIMFGWQRAETECIRDVDSHRR